ncbi:MAG: hypothetical protein HYW48_01345 [Deltaproteobacteria bacterium]|nr:hypothetical protein [Deltaproteobacteria bacterium]
MLPFFLRINIALLFLGAQPLWAADDYPEFLKHLGSHYDFRRVFFDRNPTESPLDPWHRWETADGTFGANGAYYGKALDYRKRTKTRPSQADLGKLRVYLHTHRQTIPAPKEGDPSWSFEELMEMYRLTGIYEDKYDREPSDLFQIFGVHLAGFQIDKFLLLLDIRIRLASIPITKLWQAKLLTGPFGVGVDKLTWLQLREILEEEDNARFLEWFRPAPTKQPVTQFEAILEGHDEETVVDEDEADQEVAHIYDRGGGGLRRTTTHEDLEALSAAAAAAVSTSSPPFLIELKRKAPK